MIYKIVSVVDLGEQDPRKQGLKLNILQIIHVNIETRRARSKKTRIETGWYRNCHFLFVYTRRARSKKTRIETSKVWIMVDAPRTRRARSKKTRIETSKVWIMVDAPRTRRARSKKTRIETRPQPRGTPYDASSESKIQENKDWNCHLHIYYLSSLWLGEQDPRKQGLKLW